VLFEAALTTIAKRPCRKPGERKSLDGKTLGWRIGVLLVALGDLVGLINNGNEMLSLV
jgi:hypothetical protein